MSDEYLIYAAAEARWGVRWQGQNLAIFPEKPQAIRAAIALAQIGGEQGIASTVVSEGARGERYSVWTYGQDGYVSGD